MHSIWNKQFPQSIHASVFLLFLCLYIYIYIDMYFFLGHKAMTFLKHCVGYWQEYKSMTSKRGGWTCSIHTFSWTCAPNVELVDLSAPHHTVHQAPPRNDHIVPAKSTTPLEEIHQLNMMRAEWKGAVEVENSQKDHNLLVTKNHNKLQNYLQVKMYRPMHINYPIPTFKDVCPKWILCIYEK